ncbi:DUF427 domain-containing protein [Xinfangfangia pollutisoli]|uniref:DUF427 domain-containing protein n=1 Tax=Xinfangfangia pollutisoli TaxID=2865960 RepID=UPI001CD6A101|nr:DUF427 domain-containing protein [Xinfangfangia pollutisoli]
MAGSSDSPQLHIRPAGGHHQARRGGLLLADSARVLELCEGDRPPVLYFPREDVAMALLTPRPPVRAAKGDPCFYALAADTGPKPGPILAWSHEAPRATLRALAGYLAFDPDLVSLSSD